MSDQNAIEDEERWEARLPSGEVRVGTLEQLDQAFQNGLIDENTLVRPLGDTEWQTLAEAAGLGGAEEEAPAPVAEAAPPALATPMAAPAARPFPPIAAAPLSPATGATAPYGLPTAPAQQPAVTIPGSAPSSVSPPSVAPFAAPAPAIQSTAPVVRTVSDLDLDMAPFKPRRRGVVIAAVAAVVLLAGGAVAALSSQSSEAATAPAAAAAPLPSPRAAAALLSHDNPSTDSPKSNEVAENKPASAGGGDQRFSDEMKEALLAADKERGARHQQKLRSRSQSEVRPRRSSSGSGHVFRSGGNANDPLNSAL